jgi:hypothetical protein
VQTFFQLLAAEADQAKAQSKESNDKLDDSPQDEGQ